MTTDDEQLQFLKMAAAGDADALCKACRHYAPELRVFVTSRIANYHRALIEVDEVLQETYADAFRSLARVPTTNLAAFHAWLRTVAEHNIKDAARSVGRDLERKLAPVGDASFTAFYDGIVHGSMTPSRHLTSNEIKEALEAALARLPDPYAQAIRLVDLEAKTLREAAVIMSCSIGKVWLCREKGQREMQALLGSASRFFSQG